MREKEALQGLFGRYSPKPPGGQLYPLTRGRGLPEIAGAIPPTNPKKFPTKDTSKREVPVIMGKAIECICENNVLKPLGKVPFREGERIRVTVERNLPSGPIQLRKNLHHKKIRHLRTKNIVPEEFVLKITEMDCENRENYILPRKLMTGLFAK